MSGLSDSKRRAMAILMDRAPEEVLEAIEVRFHSAGPGLAADVASLARHERLERAVLRQVFGPLLPMMAARADGVPAPQFPRRVPKMLWEQVVQRQPEMADKLVTMVHLDPQTVVPVALADSLCAEAAAVLRSEEPARLGLKSPEQADDLAAYFDMMPMARSAVDQVPTWLGRLDGGQLTALRLTFKDADAIRPDGGIRLMEILVSRMPRAAEVMRVVAALTEPATAEFIDSTEMAHFPARLLDHVEAVSARVVLDRPRLSREMADQGVHDLVAISDIFREFDVGFPGISGGSWTRRLQAVRRQLTTQMEAAYRAMPQAVEKALPLVSTKLAGRMSRLVPDLTAEPSSDAVARASALLRILEGTRLVAVELGCEGARRAAADVIAERVDAYAEEGLHMLHDNAVTDPQRAIALITVAAEFLGLSRNAEAEALVLRRAAVATSTPDTGGVAA